MADWKQRENAEGWMLLNLALALEHTEGVRASAEVRQHALDNLPWDHTTSRHAVTLAFQAVIDGKVDECRDLLSRAIDSEVPEYFQFVACLTKSLLAAHSNDTDEAAAKWRAARSVRPVWYKDKGLRSFFRAYRTAAKPHFQGSKHRWLLAKAGVGGALRRVNSIFE